MKIANHHKNGEQRPLNRPDDGLPGRGLPSGGLASGGLASGGKRRCLPS